jgi:Uma2 family endonuclease
MVALPKHYWTVEEYLAFERASDQRHEYYDGEIFDIVGGTSNHSLIIGNAYHSLRNQLDNTSCLVYTSDMRVKITSSLYTYPDISVVCEPPQFEDKQQDTLVNPVLIIEVLSPSTEQYDRGKKFEHYRRLASLRDNVLISQTRPHIEVFSRQSDTAWLFSEVTPHSSIELPSIRCTLGFSEAYRKVSLPES